MFRRLSSGGQGATQFADLKEWKILTGCNALNLLMVLAIMMQIAIDIVMHV